MSGALDRMISDTSAEEILGGYWVFVRRAMLIGIPVLMVIGGITLGLNKVIVAIIAGGSIGPLLTLERKFILDSIKEDAGKSP